MDTRRHPGPSQDTATSDTVKKKFPAIVHVHTPGGTIYFGKILEVNCPPDRMTYAELEAHICCVGPSFFSWSLHPDGHRLVDSAISQLRLLIKNNGTLERQHEIVVDTREKSVRLFAPL